MNEYWRNEQIIYVQPTDASIVGEPHCLFYDPAVSVEAIEHQTLEQLCTWANENIKEYGLEQFYNTERNYYDLANLVKFNMWIKDIKAQGIVKPMLLNYTGNWIYQTNTGESRLRCLEVVPDIRSVSAFITTHEKHRDRFTNLVEIKNAEQFFAICNTPAGTLYSFKFTDLQAPYGIEWFDYASKHTQDCMLSDDRCIQSIQNYFKSHGPVIFDRDWFCKAVDWSRYENC
jgi:hypothetical protein